MNPHTDHDTWARAARPAHCARCYASALITPLVLAWGTLASLRWLVRRLRRA
ncbi:hypothetical protein [Kallotenue papyrolyticum]|uniref:hypothetical protein n=1 Tax=Kallotenue papyrolyticum TaxID=1325125 RepID=UPI0004B43D73|nr:hypothetical protein [Kallotenue papyrolyticum]